MKKITGFITICMFITSLAVADTEFPDFFSRLEFQTYGGLSLPTDNSFLHLYNVGTNEGASLGYRFDGSFSVLVDENLHSFSSSDSVYYTNGVFIGNSYKTVAEDIFELAILAKYRVRSSHSKISPYFFAGGGLAWNDQYYVSAFDGFSGFNDWNINPMLEGGMGLQWAANDVVGVFLQQKISMVFNSNRNFVVDSPIDYFSVEAGINISLQTPLAPSSGADANPPNLAPAEH
jgi:hypothetical protein